MKRKIIVIAQTLLILMAAMRIGAAILFLLPVFGGIPSGVRLERMKRSPNYRQGQFHNQIPTTMMTTNGKGDRVKNMWKFLFGDKSSLQPAEPLEMTKCDLKHLPEDKDI